MLQVFGAEGFRVQFEVVGFVFFAVSTWTRQLACSSVGTSLEERGGLRDRLLGVFRLCQKALT